MQFFLLFVGLDVSKDTFHAAFRMNDKLVHQGCYENNTQGISAFIQVVFSFQADPEKVLVAMEHCGVYLEKIVMGLAGENIFTWLWNPLLAKHAPLELNRHKDDPRDAQSMARLAQIYQSQAKRHILPSQAQQRIKALFLLRSQLVKQRTQLYNQQDTLQCKAIPDAFSTATFKELIEIISLRIKEINKKLKAIIFDSKRLKRIYEILISIPALGPVTAVQLIEVTQGFTSFTSDKALAKYIGTMPLTFESGTSVKRKPRSSYKTHKPLKVNLTLGAISLIRDGLFFHQFYHYKTQVQKKEHFKVINIIRNIVIKLAFKLVQKDQKFDPEIFTKNKKSWQNFLTLS